jgi:anti-sigma-K factor RskA
MAKFGSKSPAASAPSVAGKIGPAAHKGTRLAPWLIAASIVLAGGVGVIALQSSRQAAMRQQQLADLTAKYESLQASNREIVQVAEARLAELKRREGIETALAAEQAKTIDLARQLAEASSSLDAAQKTIAIYQAPQDPTILARNRTELLAAPGTVRIAWAPFDLPDAPAEQRGVSGDVIWNDEKEQGYLRFVGLKVNDPNLEQYQVWVIDERGMEQKISGGIFNASADGEVIVPIKPGIDVRRVKLFAVTIEEPGGTWVPNLKRRVVVAPREG